LKKLTGTNLGPQFTIAEEMDWDKNGMVNFKEFLFAFTNWVGIDDNEDEED
jgi:calcium-binding protein CML